MIGVVPKRLARHYADRLRLIEPPVPIRGLRVALVWHERTHRDPAQVWLRNVVASSVSEDSDAEDRNRCGQQAETPIGQAVVEAVTQGEAEPKSNGQDGDVASDQEGALFMATEPDQPL